MKLSVSLPEDDVEFVDEFARRHASASRSAVIHQAITLLRNATLENAYAAAWDEWADDADDTAGAWEGTAADGLADAGR
ncbi:Ribbon-helix-helix protein, copG family [Amycolatopsis arida]|uniref:Ribbon-helix-helix protein, copG family n=1 Tax=Amycolatopsis arida TaxID=587909 RepID=A0A1I5SF13_9PSEU|nr:ribbon-helix-helix domain-containing protein [Amycolatopsis arida]TDX96495.1 ribbon-helix-helix CopG family protein [Amycolatopsis arida]SFP69323.1 Ribbon-helix-helix protein, copG family [Amycolatopsis arida]